MSHQNTTFQQLLQLIPRHDFEKWVKKHKGEFHTKGFSCWSQFTAMLFGQLSSQSGLRGIESGLGMSRNNYYHMGIRDIKRSTLAYANQHRSHEIYQDLFYSLLGKLHGNQKKHKFRFKNPLYSIDASTIDLCMNLFPWARFRKHKAGIKLHVKLNHSGYIPTFVSVTDGKVHENNAIKDMPFESGDILVFDRGYTDYKQYSNYCRKGIYFVTRIKRNADYDVVEENDVEKHKNINFDKIIKMTGFYTEKNCPEPLRMIKSYDPETKKTIVLLTNHMSWSPKTIAKIYKDRWQIEVFFKTIKQNLKIKSFFGTSRNAVLTQIWISMIAFLLLKYLTETSSQSWTVGSLMAVIPVLLFLRKDIWIWLNNPKSGMHSGLQQTDQLELFI